MKKKNMLLIGIGAVMAAAAFSFLKREMTKNKSLLKKHLS